MLSSQGILMRSVKLSHADLSVSERWLCWRWAMMVILQSEPCDGDRKTGKKDHQISRRLAESTEMPDIRNWDCPSAQGSPVCGWAAEHERSCPATPESHKLINAWQGKTCTRSRCSKSCLKMFPLDFTQAGPITGRLHHYFGYSFTASLSNPGRNKHFHKVLPSQNLSVMYSNMKLQMYKGLSVPLGWFSLSLSKQKWSDCKCHWTHPFSAVPAILLWKNWVQC